MRRGLGKVIHSAANSAAVAISTTETHLHRLLGGLTILLAFTTKIIYIYIYIYNDTGRTYGLLSHHLLLLLLLLLDSGSSGAGGLIHGESVGVPRGGVGVLIGGRLEPGEVEHGGQSVDSVWTEE